MERLEELPGNLFQLITKPPKKSAQSLNALLNDREAFDKAISDVVDHRSYTIVSILNRHSIHKDIDTDTALLLHYHYLQLHYYCYYDYLA